MSSQSSDITNSNNITNMEAPTEPQIQDSAVATSVASSLVPVAVHTENKPGNLQQLLLVSSSLQSAPKDAMEPMDNEKHKFLNHILNEMTIDLEMELKKIIDILANVKDDMKNYDEFENLLDETADKVCSLDVANLFYQLGGLDVLIPILMHTFTGLRHRAAKVIAECCQNNPFCSQQTTCSVAFNLLMDLAANKDQDMTVKFQALSAISAVIRGNPDGVARFQFGNGFAILKDALDNGNEKIASKCAFLIMSLCDTDDSAKFELLGLGIVESLITLARLTSDLMAEYFFRALLSITNNCPQAINECLRLEFDFMQFLKKIILTKEGDEACRELVECAQELQMRLENRETT